MEQLERADDGRAADERRRTAQERAPVDGAVHGAGRRGGFDELGSSVYAGNLVVRGRDSFDHLLNLVRAKGELAFDLCGVATFVVSHVRRVLVGSGSANMTDEC